MDMYRDKDGKICYPCAFGKKCEKHALKRKNLVTDQRIYELTQK